MASGACMCYVSDVGSCMFVYVVVICVLGDMLYQLTVSVTVGHSKLIINTVGAVVGSPVTGSCATCCGTGIEPALVGAVSDYGIFISSIVMYKYYV